MLHDLFEHVNGKENIGSLWDECQAFGVAFFGRVVGNATEIPFTKEEFALRSLNEIELFVKDSLTKDMPSMKGIPRYKELEEAISINVNEHTRRRNYRRSHNIHIRPYSSGFNENWWRRFLFSHMRIGYHKAVLKYGDPLEFGAFMKKASAQLSEGIFQHNPREGYSLIVTHNYEQKEFRFRFLECPDVENHYKLKEAV